jgi:hypothetical protein
VNPARIASLVAELAAELRLPAGFVGSLDINLHDRKMTRLKVNADPLRFELIDRHAEAAIARHDRG